jgi:hypothetical protein
MTGRRPQRLAIGGLGVAAVLAATPVLVGVGYQNALPPTKRIHRLVLPPLEGTVVVPGPIPEPAPTLPRSLLVDEIDLPGGAFALRPSRTVVGAGEVSFGIYNRSMDDHDLAVYGNLERIVLPSDTSLGSVFLPMKVGENATSRTLAVTLPAGRYRIVCSLGAGTSASHDQIGMNFFLTVQ